jgi:nicotinamide phosphoribosyltransferase
MKSLINSLPTTILCDFYKISHRNMYPKGTEVVYSTWTPRASRMKGVDKVVVFGQQAFIKTYLMDFFSRNFFDRPKADVLAEYKRVIKYTLGVAEPETAHIEKLHNLGYLPLSIKALPEGTLAPLRVPTMTIENTDKRFFWLTNFIESLASCELWQPATSATIAHEYRKILNRAALQTVGDTGFVQFQGHDFSFRGMSSLQASVSSGMGHLLSFVGTDTIPAIVGAEVLYNANIEKELVGTSIPATEHSIQCTYGDDMKYLEEMLSVVHPNGFVSIVSDGYDFWDVVSRVLPALKSKIMARSGGPVGDRVVIRPDSGDPVKIVCGDPLAKTELERKGAVEALWDIFGGTVTSKGFKLLDSHIGLIYGDAITLSRAQEICDKLAAKGFASINCVYGIGSYTYQYNTRDTFGFALKSTMAVINGDEKQIFKDPKTDNGIKKSQKGRVAVLLDSSNQLFFVDQLTLKEKVEGDQLVEVFRDGKLLVDQSFSEIRARLARND